jgi:hypothetical protein
MLQQPPQVWIYTNKEGWPLKVLHRTPQNMQVSARGNVCLKCMYHGPRSNSTPPSEEISGMCGSKGVEVLLSQLPMQRHKALGMSQYPRKEMQHLRK